MFHPYSGIFSPSILANIPLSLNIGGSLTLFCSHHRHHHRNHSMFCVFVWFEKAVPQCEWLFKSTYGPSNCGLEHGTMIHLQCWAVGWWITMIIDIVLLIVSGGYHGEYLSVGVILPKANVSRNSSYFLSFGSWAAFGMKLQLVEWAIWQVKKHQLSLNMGTSSGKREVPTR